jgi:hypothetical protein
VSFTQVLDVIINRAVILSNCTVFNQTDSVT